MSYWVMYLTHSLNNNNNKQVVRVATQYAPAPLPLSGRRSASRRRADRNIAVRSQSQYVPTLTAAAA